MLESKDFMIITFYDIIDIDYSVGQVKHKAAFLDKERAMVEIDQLAMAAISYFSVNSVSKQGYYCKLNNREGIDILNSNGAVIKRFYLEPRDLIY